MGIFDAAFKYKFDGIAKASATVTFLALASTSFAPLTIGFTGKVFFFFLQFFYTGLASIGLVVLNIGIADLKTISEKNDFDGSFDEAFKIINAKGGKLTDAEKKSIDNKVIAAFRKFGAFGQLFDDRNS